MRLEKSRKSKNVVDARNVGDSVFNSRVRSKTPMTRQKRTFSSTADAIMSNPAINRPVTKRNPKDPAPRSIKSPTAKKGPRKKK